MGGITYDKASSKLKEKIQPICKAFVIQDKNKTGNKQTKKASN